MKNIFAQSVAMCNLCAQEFPSYYEERPDGVFLHFTCIEHGAVVEQVESDAGFFKEGYFDDYERLYKHLALPITYRCNLNCKFCYSMSNCSNLLPPDRPIERILYWIKLFEGKVTLIGGEPTLRDDLFEIIRRSRVLMGTKKLSLCTNGFKLKELAYVEKLKEVGIDFLAISVNAVDYEGSQEIFDDKIKVLENCRKAGMIVNLQRTIDKMEQIDSFAPVVESFSDIVFNLFLRAAQPYGVRHPEDNIFVSGIIKHLKIGDNYKKGDLPMHRYIKWKGKRTRVSSYTNDIKRIEPLDTSYVISNDTLTSCRRAMHMDEVLLRKYMTTKSDEIGKRSKTT